MIFLIFLTFGRKFDHWQLVFRGETIFYLAFVSWHDFHYFFILFNMIAIAMFFPTCWWHQKKNNISFDLHMTCVSNTAIADSVANNWSNVSRLFSLFREEKWKYDIRFFVVYRIVYKNVKMESRKNLINTIFILLYWKRTR